MSSDETSPTDCKNSSQLVEHFFRREYGKLVATLSRVFGVHNLELAEDTVQSALIEALQSWRSRGVPSNPTAWIYRVAKNRLVDQLRRQTTIERYQSQWLDERVSMDEISNDVSDLFVDTEIEDSQLRLIFACCHPAIALQDRIALTLSTLCGFGLAEISRGMLIGESTLRKRIYRAKKHLAENDCDLETPASTQLIDRLDAVHQVLYLLFNEGYSRTEGEIAIREDICEEAARLCHILTMHEHCSTPGTKALLALMLFHAARLPARMDDQGALILLEEQERQKWDWPLIGQASRLLVESAEGKEWTRYHLEAGIAFQHCSARDVETTNWDAIVKLYDRLQSEWPSPIYSLNRAIAVSRRSGPQSGLELLEEIESDPMLQEYYLLDATFADFYQQLGNKSLAIRYYHQALRKSPSHAETQLLANKLEKLSLQSSSEDTQD